MSNTKSGGALSLPGDVEAFINAPIYAQVSGYLQKWYFDIGAKVKKNELLAQIDPRTYQAALAQAKGALARDSATLANARVDLARYQALAAQNAISQQQLATQQATVNSDAGLVDEDRATGFPGRRSILPIPVSLRRLTAWSPPARWMSAIW